MPAPVKLVVDADMAKAFSAFTRLVEHQTRAEKGMEKLAAAGDRADRAATAATQKMVARIQATTRGAKLAVSQADRVAMKAGFDPGGGALGTAIARRAAAGDIRLGRATAGFDSARSSFLYARSLGERMAREAKMAREALANERAMFAGNVAASGAALTGPGGSRLEAGARRFVAGRVMGSFELYGKVSPADMENMVHRHWKRRGRRSPRARTGRRASSMLLPPQAAPTVTPTATALDCLLVGTGVSTQFHAARGGGFPTRNALLAPAPVDTTLTQASGRMRPWTFRGRDRPLHPMQPLQLRSIRDNGDRHAEMSVARLRRANPGAARTLRRGAGAARDAERRDSPAP